MQQPQKNRLNLIRATVQIRWHRIHHHLHHRQARNPQAHQCLLAFFDLQNLLLFLIEWLGLVADFLDAQQDF